MYHSETQRASNGVRGWLNGIATLSARVLKLAHSAANLNLQSQLKTVEATGVDGPCTVVAYAAFLFFYLLEADDTIGRHPFIIEEVKSEAQMELLQV